MVLKFSILGIIIVSLTSCINSSFTSSEKNYSLPTAYFSLKNYFKDQARHLQHEKVNFIKKITVNGHSQTKQIHEVNWTDELVFFSESDINKPSWIGKYKVIKIQNNLCYQAMDSNLKVRTFSIIFNHGIVKHVQIKQSVKNFLYTMDEELDYIPDSMYSINRKQTIKMLGNKTYLIQGFVNNFSKH